MLTEQEIRDVLAWIDELRHGGHKQTFNAMMRIDQHQKSYCAIGVYCYHIMSSFNWSRDEYPFGDVIPMSEVISMNDSAHLSFTEIADSIEASLEDYVRKHFGMSLAEYEGTLGPLDTLDPEQEAQEGKEGQKLQEETAEKTPGEGVEFRASGPHMKVKAAEGRKGEGYHMKETETKQEAVVDETQHPEIVAKISQIVLEVMNRVDKLAPNVKCKDVDIKFEIG